MKGIVSVLHLGKTKKEEVVKSYSSSQITFVHNHGTNSNKLMILGNEYILHPNKNMNTEEVSVMTRSTKTLLSHPSIVERYVTATKIATKMFDTARIKSAQKPRQDNPMSTGKCTRIAIIFNTVNRTGTMKATCIYSRVPYLALCSDPYNKWYFWFCSGSFWFRSDILFWFCFWFCSVSRSVSLGLPLFTITSPILTN